ncbi:uncharacterized protein LOC118168617 isoform X2 [Oxyura jamaicensis]|uniref:uncharacterized protein LOC118168617 isoform X2 n=1 Tax=Oxyura jamaicensis TaxID=8884 RepID=UPI0015A6BCBD|nr:uncharacterized protein LOC118168617 isoform X2 [Oxyura jamaicensis]
MFLVWAEIPLAGVLEVYKSEYLLGESTEDPDQASSVRNSKYNVPRVYGWSSTICRVLFFYFQYSQNYRRAQRLSSTRRTPTGVRPAEATKVTRSLQHRMHKETGSAGVVVTPELLIDRKVWQRLHRAWPLPDSISGNCLSLVTLLLSWRLPGTVTSNDTAQRVLVRTITTALPWCLLRFIGCTLENEKATSLTPHLTKPCRERKKCLSSLLPAVIYRRRAGNTLGSRSRLM